MTREVVGGGEHVRGGAVGQRLAVTEVEARGRRKMGAQAGRIASGAWA